MIAFLDIGFGELIVVAFVGLLLYGGRLPEMMRTMGGSYRKLKRSVEDLTRQATTVEQPRQGYRPEPPKSADAMPRPPSVADAAPAGNSHPAPTATTTPAAPAAPARTQEDDAPLI